MIFEGCLLAPGPACEASPCPLLEVSEGVLCWCIDCAGLIACNKAANLQQHACLNPGACVAVGHLLIDQIEGWRLMFLSTMTLSAPSLPSSLS